jgi:hypothetical protein
LKQVILSTAIEQQYVCRYPDRYKSTFDTRKDGYRLPHHVERQPSGFRSNQLLANLRVVRSIRHGMSAIRQRREHAGQIAAYC